MRELKYAIEGKAANLRTFAADEPGNGGANHEYHIEGPLEPATALVRDTARSIGLIFRKARLPQAASESTASRTKT